MHTSAQMQHPPSYCGDVAYQHLPIWIYSNRSWSSHTESFNEEQVPHDYMKASSDTGPEPELIMNCSQHLSLKLNTD